MAGVRTEGGQLQRIVEHTPRRQHCQRQTHRHADGKRQTHRQREIDRETHRETDRETDTQTVRGRHAEGEGEPAPASSSVAVRNPAMIASQLACIPQSWYLQRPTPISISVVSDDCAR